VLGFAAWLPAAKDGRALCAVLIVFLKDTEEFAGSKMARPGAGKLRPRCAQSVTHEKTGIPSFSLPACPCRADQTSSRIIWRGGRPLSTYAATLIRTVLYLCSLALRRPAPGTIRLHGSRGTGCTQLLSAGGHTLRGHLRPALPSIVPPPHCPHAGTGVHHRPDVHCHC